MILLVSKIALNKPVIPVSASAVHLDPHAYQLPETNQEHLPFKGKKKRDCLFSPSNTVFTQIYSIHLTW